MIISVSESRHDRRIYELARKHCGEQDEWKISLELLHKKTGASSHYREFKSMIRELVENDHLPDYRVALEDEMVIFRNRMSMSAEGGSPLPGTRSRGISHAKQVAPGYDVYTWNRNGELVGGKRHAGTWFSRQSIYGFCRSALSAQPNP